MTTLIESSVTAAGAELDRFVEHATKVVRVASTIEAVDRELDHWPVGTCACNRLALMHRRLVIELASALSDDGQAELAAFVKMPDPDHPTEQAVRVGFAQLAGWVRGLEEAAAIEARFVAPAVEAAT